MTFPMEDKAISCPSGRRWVYYHGYTCWPHPLPPPQDNGDIPLKTVRALTIVVTDVNDQDPIFSQTVYAIDVHENLTFVSTFIYYN